MEFGGVLYLDAEKIAGKGEDAQTFSFDEDGNGYMFVFDGCGGAGSEIHPGLGSATSARIASHACTLFFDNFFASGQKTDTAVLSRQLHDYLRRINDAYPMDHAESTLIDVLPATVSGVMIGNTGESVCAGFVWAGDSRGYLLDSKGLTQVTEDDVDSPDAYQNLFDDAIMTNRVHGNPARPLFRLHAARVTVQEPCIVICATDGCYDYFKSPMVFEFFLISMLAASDSFAQAEEKLLEILHDRSGDDCSLIAAFYGFSDYAQVRAFLRERFEALSADKHSFNADYWENGYKQQYYRRNPRRKADA